MDKVKLNFMVVPEELATKAFVPNPIRVKIIDPEAIFLTGILGESGRKLVEAGIEFYFEGSLARKLIEKGIAEEIKVKDGYWILYNITNNKYWGQDGSCVGYFFDMLDAEVFEEEKAESILRLRGNKKDEIMTRIFNKQ